jgi:hypothetical protein
LCSLACLVRRVRACCIPISSVHGNVQLRWRVAGLSIGAGASASNSIWIVLTQFRAIRDTGHVERSEALHGPQSAKQEYRSTQNLSHKTDSVCRAASRSPAVASATCRPSSGNVKPESWIEIQNGFAGPLQTNDVHHMISFQRAPCAQSLLEILFEATVPDAETIFEKT